MKIKSCKIKAFGSITDKTYDFEGDLICHLQNNGEGKTTLADFVRVMLYGMKTTKTSDSSMGDRRHYLPYESKKDYGGSMTIEVGGEEIVIVRTFDKKSAPNDTLTINGEPVTETEQTIGEKYFNIDEDAFRRTVYISSLTNNSEAVQGTDSINRNMDQMVTDITTLNLENVYKTLDERCSEIKSGRGRKKPGKINLLEEEKDKINAELEELRNVDENLSVKYPALNSLRRETEELSNKIEAQQKVVSVLGTWKRIDDIQSRIDQGKEALNTLRSAYPKGLVTPEDNSALKNANSAIVKAESALEAMKENEEDKKNLDELRKLFANGFDKEEYDKVKDLKQSADDELIRIESESKSPLIGEELAKTFAEHTPSAEDMLGNRRLAQTYKDNESTLQSLATMSGSAPMPTKWIVAGIIGIVSGIVLITLGYMPIGIAIAGIAVAGIVLALILSKRGANQVSQARAVQLTEENKRIENKLKRFYAPYGFYETSFLDYSDNLQGMVESYVAYKSNKEKRDSELKMRSEAVEVNKKQVSAYLSRYGASDLARIETDYNLYVKLKSTSESWQAKREEAKAIIESNRETLALIFGKYGFSVPGNIENAIQQHTSDLNLWDTLTATIKDSEENIRKIKIDNKLTERPEEPKETEDIGVLKSELQIKIREEGRLMDDITTDEKRLEETDKLKARLVEIDTEKSVLSERLALLNKTIGYLKSADKALKDRFVGPVRDSYSEYMRALLPHWADNIEMGTDYRVRVKVDDVAHDCGHLSQGERTCLELALRIAVIDNMYKGEKPFLIMDDPFVELDEENMRKATQLLKNISERYQVVYFCCHEARAI